MISIYNDYKYAVAGIDARKLSASCITRLSAPFIFSGSIREQAVIEDKT